MPKAAPNRQTLAREIRALRDSQRTMVLASASTVGEPEVSATPYVIDSSGDYFILLSNEAAHAGNLQQNRRVSLLFLEPEGETGQIYTRPRLVLSGRAEPIERDSERWQGVLTRLYDYHGPVGRQPREQPEFQLYRIHPDSGRYIRSMGESYLLEGPGMQPHVPE